MITVIEQSTNKRKQETMNLFNKIKPYLDKGYGYRNALIKINYITETIHLNNRNGWFRDLTEYGASKGYPYHNHRFKRSDKIGVKRVKSYDWMPYHGWRI